jgi:uncharacterized protein
VFDQRPTLLLFARAPMPGSVKTRLVSVLGPEGAARLYRAFLEDAARVYDDPRWSPVLYADPDPNEPALVAIFGPPWRREAQVTGDLGSRLSEAFRAERSRVPPAILAVGSDHPALSRHSLQQLFEAIRSGEDAALIPAHDGGYCAIALSPRAELDAVFDEIPWSSAGTLEKTLERMRRRRMRVGLLAPAYDVDRPEDLERLVNDLAARDPAADDYPRETATVLLALAPKWSG